MKLHKLLAATSFGLTLVLPMHDAMAWGQLGHRVIGEIAQQNLTDEVNEKITDLLDGASLAEVSTWGDEIRSSGSWDHAAPWHYVSIDDHETWKTVKRNPHGDVIAAMELFEKALRNPNSTIEQKWQALAFYVHFVGDIHQPLHVGYADDWGGNKIKLKWFGENTNLHSVWDTELVEQQGLSFTEMTRFIGRISEKERNQWQGKNYYEWADESKALRKATYTLEKNRDGEDDLRYQYVYDHTPTVKLRLRQAGVRLAEKLNDIFK
ncbi:S1/P1 nuclease [Shewanella sp. WXL01]|uniref:S1/P1 nuclease n=1 Tax=Shewanella sp. WXL01 TaxID=2709721 RepID=UPI001438542B|nr:S1/P1 nuclease [Shewanella sp. WXL01]NKF51670.1 S1/P1 nuclease [Shewanella sp. WXL01]